MQRALSVVVLGQLADSDRCPVLPAPPCCGRWCFRCNNDPPPWGLRFYYVAMNASCQVFVLLQPIDGFAASETAQTGQILGQIGQQLQVHAQLADHQQVVRLMHLSSGLVDGLAEQTSGAQAVDTQFDTRRQQW